MGRNAEEIRMAAAIALDGAITTGHGKFPPTVMIATSTNVFVNGKRVVLNGDSIVIHCDPESCHSGNAIATSSVFINGRQACTIGNSISCGDTIAQGSSNVFIG